MTSSKRPSSRKSIAYLPSPDLDSTIGDKENSGAKSSEASNLLDTANGLESKQKRSRSKSLGPGGLEALKEDAGNKRKIVPAPRSILKPTFPLSPLKEIPARKPTAQAKPIFRSPGKNTQASTSPTRSTRASASPIRRHLQSPSRASPQKPLSQEEPVVEVVQLERQRQREAIQKQRDARRKSLANRRVSFAPEATLHTFDNLEDLQDSTTSSTSPNSTRRASPTTQNNFFASSTRADDETPSTPTKNEQEAVKDSPADQRDLRQQKRRRRSSAIPPVNLYHPDDVALSSPFSDVVASEYAVLEPSAGPESPSHCLSSTQSSPGSMMDLDQNVQRQHNGDAGESSPFAAHEEIENDEEDDGTAMEIVGDEVTAAFRPWVQRQQSGLRSAKLVALSGRENFNPFSPAFKSGQDDKSLASPATTAYDNTDMSMDITRAIGGIIRGQASPKRRKSNVSRRRSSGAYSSEDGTMEFTTAVGGIQSIRNEEVNDSNLDDNEDLSMEFTNVFGGVPANAHKDSQEPPQATEDQDVSMEDGEDMDMATSLGQLITRPNTIADEPEEDETQMDMTRVVGGILQPKVPVSPVRTGPNPLLRAATTAAFKASPNMSSPHNHGTAGHVETPPKGLRTPEKQITPQPADRPTTPSKTPPPNIAMRHPSPKRLFKAEIKQAKSSPVIQSPGTGLFDLDQAKGTHTPRIRLMPRSQTRRHTSGVGLDKEGLGSPRVAALLDRRASIGDLAQDFAPQGITSRGVHFQDPRQIEAEVLRDREEDERRESGIFTLQTEADGNGDERDATMTLKEAIVGMSPKKKKLNGRKSLAVGAAKGILGKRPLELDDVDDEEGTPISLRGREGSPVKRIRLQAPPSASETTGRLRSVRASLGVTTGNERPMTPPSDSQIRKLASTPSHDGHFKNVENLGSIQKFVPSQRTDTHSREELESVVPQDEDRIGLQDFLNLTSIRFMELSTTKRRHTIAPIAVENTGVNAEQDPGQQFADAVVASACTLPMLELYQHSCRELKKYIAEGRSIVREIEAATAQENPQLFREYLSASPADRAIMDSQFKDMKTHARHLSKGMWYEWRMKLLDGLREGLVKEANGFRNDDVVLSGQEQTVRVMIPALLEEHEKLLAEATELQQYADEIADCDQNDLYQARQQIISAEQQIREKKERIVQLQVEAQRLDSTMDEGREATKACQQEIREAQRVREEHRGWSEAEVNKLKAKVDSLEAEHDWSIITAAGSQLTMVYRGQLELFFDVKALLPAAAGDIRPDPISLSFIGDTIDCKPQLLTIEKRFFLQMMQAHLHSLSQNQTSVQALLKFVSSTWSEALSLAEEVRRLDIEGITHCDILSDERLAVRTMLLVPTAESKVDVIFEIGAAISGMAIAVKLKTKAESVYGQQYQEDKLREFLKTRISESMVDGSGSWASAVRELKRKLVAKGKN